MKEVNNQIRQVIVVLVKQDKILDYESWLAKLNKEIVNFDGFNSQDVIRKQNDSTMEYLIINRFHNHERYLAWINSEILKSFLKEAERFVQSRVVKTQKIGVDLYMDVNNEYNESPKLYKKLIIGVLTVYPIILVSNYTFFPVLNGLDLNTPLRIFISTCIISPLIGISLPYTTKWFKAWLME